MSFVDLAGAARLVGKSERQIRRYIAQGLLRPAHPGVKRYRAADVVVAEREARGRVGRPRKATGNGDEMNTNHTAQPNGGPDA